MTPRERMQAEMELLELQQAEEMESTSTAAPEQEMSFGDKLLGGVNAFGQGISASYADEGGSAIAAGMAKLAGADEDYSDIYSQMMDNARTDREQFADENQKTALALEVLGGFVTGGAGGAKVLGSSALKNAGKLKKTLAAAGVGGVEGGIAGFGAGDSFEDRLMGAGTGATIGTVLPLAISGLGQMPRLASKRPDDIPLLDGPNGEFTPLPMAAPNSLRASPVALGGISYGGKDLVRQGETIVAKAQRNADNIQAKIKGVNKAAKQKVLDSKTNITRSAQDNVGNIKQTTAAQTEALTQRGGNITNNIEAGFRKKAVNASTPASMPAKDRAALEAMDSQTANDTLGRYWLDNGFESAKSKTFDLDMGKFQDDISDLFKNDAGLRDKAGDYTANVMNDFDVVFNRPAQGSILSATGKLPKQTTAGSMSGSDLMELRNKYARSANDTSDPLLRTAHRKVADKLDEQITSRLNGPELAQYQDDMNRWGAYSTYKKAVGSAANRKQGQFTQDDWLTATKNYKLSKGKGVLQDTAQKAQVRKTALKKTVARQNKATKVKMDTNIAEVNRAKQDAILNDPAKAQAVRLEEAGRSKLKRTKAKLEATKKLAPKEKGFFTKLGASIILSGGAAGVGSPLVGGAVAKGLVSKPVQRGLAGQLESQGAMRNLLDTYDAKKVKGQSLADILRQGTSAAGVAGTTED